MKKNNNLNILITLEGKIENYVFRDHEKKQLKHTKICFWKIQNQIMCLKINFFSSSFICPLNSKLRNRFSFFFVSSPAQNYEIYRHTLNIFLPPNLFWKIEKKKIFKLRLKKISLI